MLERFVRDENAATAIEYALIAAMISLAIVAGANGIFDALQETYQNAAAKLEDANRR